MPHAPYNVRPIELRSDNAAGTAREILEAIANANVGSALAYGADEWTARLHDIVREVFEHPTARIFPVGSGTAANSLSLSAMCPPWGAVLCHESAHILQNECGATSMFGGGVVMRGLSGGDYRLNAESLERAFATTRWGDNHASQPSVLSLTVPTDHGTLYSLAEIGTLAAMAKERRMKVHIDGARIANAIAMLECPPADITWRAGVDVVSLGALKNGSLSTDAILCFDDGVAAELFYRVKRAGHVASKMRFQSVQLEAYLTDGLWLRCARNANQTMARLAAGLDKLGLQLENRPDVNMVFVRVPDDVADGMERAGLFFYRIAPGLIRLVTSFQTTVDDVDDALERIAGLIS
jgi:threonine aldolase